MTQRIEYTEELVGNAHPTKADTLNRFVNLITTQGDLLQGSAAATATRLAIGAANTKLFVNAAGTLAEWASGIKLGTFTRDMSSASGDVAYTGVGFKPKAIIFWAAESTIVGAYSIGIDDGTTHLYLQGYYGAAGAAAAGSGSSILVQEDATGFQSALVKTMDADGFTLTWTKGATPTGTIDINYIAFR